MQVIFKEACVPSRLERLYSRVVKRTKKDRFSLDDMDMTVIRSGPFTICELFHIPMKKRGYGIAIRSYGDHENRTAGEAISFTRAAEDLLKKLQ